MGRIIILYKKDGTRQDSFPITESNLERINGMMTKCTLTNGEEVVGFGDPYRIEEKENDSEVHDYIILWTWKNLDESTHKLVGENKFATLLNRVNISDIMKVESILYSNPRWGGLLTNQFTFSTKKAR